MKIEFTNLNNYLNLGIDQKKQSTLGETSEKSEKHFDEIKIQAKTTPDKEHHFATSLSERVSMELRQPTNSSRIEELKKQIEQGLYEIDLNAIAERITLY